jgi:hypothetical protein
MAPSYAELHGRVFRAYQGVVDRVPYGAFAYFEGGTPSAPNRMGPAFFFRGGFDAGDLGHGTHDQVPARMKALATALHGALGRELDGEEIRVDLPEYDPDGRGYVIQLHG